MKCNRTLELVLEILCKVMHRQESILQEIKIMAETLQTLSDKVDAQTKTIKTVSDNQTQLDTDVNSLMAAYKNGQPWDQALADKIGTNLDANNATLGVVRDTETTEDAAVVGTIPPPPPA